MKYFEKQPMFMVVVAVLGCAFAGIFVKNSAAPSALTAAIRLLWTVLLWTEGGRGACWATMQNTPPYTLDEHFLSRLPPGELPRLPEPHLSHL